MAATHLTTEEAADQLGITPDEFKKRLRTDPTFKVLVPIRDGTNLRFKSGQIEELARQLGVASNPELPLSPLESVTPDSDDFKLPSAETKKSGKPSADEPLDFSSPLDSSPIDDIFSLAPDAPEAKKPKTGSDSDVRLEASKKSKKGMDDSDESHVPTEELSIDLSGPGSAIIKGGSSAKLSAPKSSGKISPKPDSGKSLAKPGTSDSSEFELSLDADSDDFELKLNTDASDEVDLGEMPKDLSGGSARRGGESGINLKSPADSGISLEKSKSKKEAEAKPTAEAAAGGDSSAGSDVDFELTLDSSAAASSLKAGGLKGKGLEADSDSEFELTLDDSSESGLEAAAEESAEAKKDIFETDFEIPPMEDSSSDSLAIDTDSDSGSDSDLEATTDSDVIVEEEGSSDVLVEEEEEAPARARKKVTAEEEGDVDLADVELEEEEGSASKALKGVKGGEDEEEEEEPALAGAGAYRPVPWGPLPALFLLPALAFTLVGGLMGYELLQTMWGYQQPRKPAAPLVRAIASNLDMEIKDQ